MNNCTPYFSVIIPVYNAAEKLKRALQSLTTQTYKNFEVIIADDGSSDASGQIVDSFKNQLDIIYVWNKKWGGPARPRNIGLQLARAESIAFLDADDWWYPQKLEIVKQFIGTSDIIFHDLDIYTPKGKRAFRKVRGRKLREPVFVDLMTNENALITSSVITTKTILKRCDGFNEENFTCVEDFDLWLRIAQITQKFTYIPRALGAYWIDSHSVSAPSEKIAERIQFVYEKFSHYLNSSEKKQALAVMNYLLARTNQRMGRLDRATFLFRKSLQSTNMKFKIRSFLWILLLFPSTVFSRKQKKHN